MTIRTCRQRPSTMDNPRRDAERARVLSRKVATAEECGRGRLMFDWQTLRGVMSGRFNAVYRAEMRKVTRGVLMTYDDELPWTWED